MSNLKFELLKELPTLKHENIDFNNIEDLKALTRKYRSTHNALVQQKWDIELKLAKNSSQKAELIKELSVIDKKIQGFDYERKIEKLLTVISAMEIEKNESSKIGGNSPYIL